jgi:hypothetical protein
LRSRIRLRIRLRRIFGFVRGAVLLIFGFFVLVQVALVFLSLAYAALMCAAELVTVDDAQIDNTSFPQSEPRLDTPATLDDAKLSLW